ncbi:MAG: hypothetical protein MR210_04935 [Erysipelotrichaceae bacterium]|nr:hypothetical protein [Erysipelotrichaceae bacterium]
MVNDLSATAFWTIWPYLLAFGLSFMIVDVKEKSPKHAKISLKMLQQQLPMVIFLLGTVLLTDTTHTITVFYNQLQYVRSGIDQAYFGLLYLTMQLVGLGAGSLGIISRYIKIEKLAVILYIACGSVCFSLIYITTPYLSIVALMGLMLIEALFLPIVSTLQQRNIIDGHRASTISIYSLITNFFGMFTSVSLGSAANSSLPKAYMVAGIFCLSGMLLYLGWYKWFGQNKDAHKNDLLEE